MSNNKHNFATLMQFLKQLTKDVLESSRVYPNQSVAGSPTNKTGYTVDLKPYRGTSWQNKSYTRPYWQCVFNNINV